MAKKEEEEEEQLGWCHDALYKEKRGERPGS